MGQSLSCFTQKASSGDLQTRRLKAITYGTFSVKRPEDERKVWVTGLLCVENTIVVLDGSNCMLKLFDRAGIHLSSTEPKQLQWGITKVRDNMFATCGNGYKIYLWTVRGQLIVSDNKSFDVDHPALRVHYNGLFFCVLHTTVTAITVLDGEGKNVRKISIKETLGHRITLGRDIQLESETNHIFVISTDDSGVLCMTIEGQAQWFCPLPMAYSITEMNDALCIADPWNRCVHLISKKGKRVKKLLRKQDLKGPPVRVQYGHDDKLYVCYDQNDKRHRTVSVYSIE